MKELIAELQEQIHNSKENNQPEDTADWNVETGILLTRREAEMILNILKIYQGTK